jgi:hypothetical protein
MLFKAPKFLNKTPAGDLPTTEELSAGYCGLHRGSYSDLCLHTPHLRRLVEDAPVDLDDYEIDIKVHMLMKGQFPCIPNWHCDNVPRLDTGELLYDQALAGGKPMLLWVSGAPTTEFLVNDIELPDPETHGELDAYIRTDRIIKTKCIPERTWLTLDQRTPHKGTAATKHGWRIFVRLTPKIISTARPVLSPIRRHTQVYLPNNFHW